MNYPKMKRLSLLSGYLFQLTNQVQLFEMSKSEEAVWDKKMQDLKGKIKKLKTEIEKFKVNKFQRRRRITEAQRILLRPQIAETTFEELAGKRVEKLLLRSQQDIENGKISPETLN